MECPLLLTADAIYWHNVSDDAGHQVDYAEIENVTAVNSKGIFGSTKLLVNKEQIEFGHDSGDEMNATAQSLADAIRHLVERRKSAGD